MKITKAIFTQKDQEYILRYWTEEKPSLTDYKYDRINGRMYFDQDLRLWQSSFKEVRIHSTQIKAFNTLAFNLWVERGSQGFFDTYQKVGIDLPPENIEINTVCENCGEVCEENCSAFILPFAFLVEGKKETLEEETGNFRGFHTSGFVDWNQFNLDQLAEYLTHQYRYLSSGEALAVLKMVDFYNNNKSKEGSKDQECVHPYHMVYRKMDFEKCNQCGKILCEG